MPDTGFLTEGDAPDDIGTSGDESGVGNGGPEVVEGFDRHGARLATRKEISKRREETASILINVSQGEVLPNQNSRFRPQCRTS